MHKATLAQGLEDIYAAHGKAFPAPKVCDAIFDRVRELPDDFVTYAVEELRDYSSLPMNLGRELRRNLWPQWLEKNPQARSGIVNSGCKNCRESIAGPGFFFVRGQDGHVVCLKCVCCEQENVSHWKAWTIYEIRAAGLEIETRNGNHVLP